MSKKKRSSKRNAKRRAAAPAATAGPAPKAPAESKAPKASKAEVPSTLPALGDRVLYREHAPGGALITRAAFVIAVGKDGCAQLAVLTIVPRAAMEPRAGACRLAAGVRYSRKAVENTWVETPSA